MAGKQKKVRNIQLEYTPRPFQKKFHVGSWKVPSSILICARQHGKTQLGCMELIDRALKSPQGASYGYVSPYATQSRKVAWPRFKSLLAPLGELVVFRETDLILTLPGERKIHMLGADNEGCRGLSLNGVVVDEFDNINKDIYQNALIPTTASCPEPFWIYIGTLSRDGPLWKLYRDHLDDPDWYCQLTTASEADVLTDEQLTRFRKEMGDSAYLREFECDPHSPVEHSVIGAALDQAKLDDRIPDTLPINPLADLHTAWDLGISDFTVVWTFQLLGSHIHVVGFHEYSGLGLVEIIKRLKSSYPNVTWGTAVLPHDIHVRDYTTGVSRLDTFRQMALGRPDPLKRTPIEETIHATRLNLDRCIFAGDRCEAGLNRLRNARYDVDNRTGTVQDRIIHDDSSHALDAFRYLCTWVEAKYPTSTSGADVFRPSRHRNEKYRRINKAVQGSVYA